MTSRSPEMTSSELSQSHMCEVLLDRWCPRRAAGAFLGSHEGLPAQVFCRALSPMAPGNSLDPNICTDGLLNEIYCTGELLGLRSVSSLPRVLSPPLCPLSQGRSPPLSVLTVLWAVPSPECTLSVTEGPLPQVETQPRVSGAHITGIFWHL